MSRADRPVPGRRAWRRRTAVVAAAIAAGLVLAGTAAGQSDELRALLPRLPDDQQAALRARDARWASWTPEQREAFSARMQAWDALPAGERQQRRLQWEAWVALDPVDRARVRGARARFAALPVGEQAAWRERFDALDASARRGWLLGPRLGADYPELQPLLAQLPEAQRAPLLQVLRSMTPEERADLAILVQRTPAHERDELRRGLLSTAEGNRAAWLRLRLGT